MTSLYVMPKIEQDLTLAAASWLRDVYNCIEPGPTCDFLNHQLFVMREKWLAKMWTAQVENLS